MRTATLGVLILLTTIAPSMRAKDEKLKAEQIIAKHLESIGPKEKLNNIKNRVTTGNAHVDIHVGGTANLTGNGVLASQYKAVRLSFKYPANQYPGEQFVFDGKDTAIGQISPGVRSQLGRYIFENDYLLKDGLLFGTLSTNWFFENLEVAPSKFDVSGPKKIDGKVMYELKYVPRKGVSNLTAYFDFDAETFRHVRSQFKAEQVLTSTDAKTKITDSAETIRYTITEQFDDFKEVDGLTLPHSYKLDFSIDSPRGGFVGSWDYVIKQIVHNQSIEADVFSTK
jgi:hypothetical protein